MLSHSRCVVKVEVGFLDTLTMVTLRIRKTEQPLLEKVTKAYQQLCGIGTLIDHTLSHSRMQRLCSVDRGYQIPQQYRPRPSERSLFLHGHA